MFKLSIFKSFSLDKGPGVWIILFLWTLSTTIAVLALSTLYIVPSPTSVLKCVPPVYNSPKGDSGYPQCIHLNTRQVEAWATLIELEQQSLIINECVVIQPLEKYKKDVNPLKKDGGFNNE